MTHWPGGRQVSICDLYEFPCQGTAHDRPPSESRASLLSVVDVVSLQTFTYNKTGLLSASVSMIIIL